MKKAISLLSGVVFCLIFHPTNTIISSITITNNQSLVYLPENYCQHIQKMNTLIQNKSYYFNQGELMNF